MSRSSEIAHEWGYDSNLNEPLDKKPLANPHDQAATFPKAPKGEVQVRASGVSASQVAILTVLRAVTIRRCPNIYGNKYCQPEHLWNSWPDVFGIKNEC